MKYIVQCACAQGTTISYTDRTGAHYSWTGGLGLATHWCPASGTPAAASVADQEWVSACLMALVNRNGSTQGSMQISAITGNPEFSSQLMANISTVGGYGGAGTDEYSAYWNLYIDPAAYAQAVNPSYKTENLLYASVYYGNLFQPSTNSSGQYGMYTALWDPVGGGYLASLKDLGRDCAVDGCGTLTTTGYVNVGSYQTNPFKDPYGRSGPPFKQVCNNNASVPGQVTSCPDNQGRTWNRVLTVIPPYFSLFDSGPTAACKADANNVMACSSTAFGKSSSYYSYASPPYWVRCTPPEVWNSPSTFKSRYKSTAAATLRLNNGYYDLGTYTLPSTNNQWQWFDVPNFDYSQSAGEVLWYGVDSTSKNAQFDVCTLSL